MHLPQQTIKTYENGEKQYAINIKLFSKGLYLQKQSQGYLYLYSGNKVIKSAWIVRL